MGYNGIPSDDGSVFYLLEMCDRYSCTKLRELCAGNVPKFVHNIL